jgi:hypothetical protein
LKRILLFVLTVFFFGCFADSVKLPPRDTQESVFPKRLKLEHVIQLKIRGKTLQFHGYFKKTQDQFTLYALGDFDTPIFKMDFKPYEIDYKVYLEQLKNRLNQFDFKEVAKDVWKIYFLNENHQLTQFADSIPIQGRSVKMEHDSLRYLTKKIIYTEEGTIINEIVYEDYEFLEGEVLPSKITFKNLGNNYELIIHTVQNLTQQEVQS